MDPLVEVPVYQWLLIRRKLKAMWPLNVPGYYALYSNESLPEVRDAFDFKVYCPFGDMDNGFVSINSKSPESQDIIVFSITDDTSKLEYALLKTKLIHWTKPVNIDLVNSRVLRCFNKIQKLIRLEKFQVGMMHTYLLSSQAIPFEDLRSGSEYRTALKRKSEHTWFDLSDSEDCERSSPSTSKPIKKGKVRSKPRSEPPKIGQHNPTHEFEEDDRSLSTSKTVAKEKVTQKACLDSTKNKPVVHSESEEDVRSTPAPKTKLKPRAQGKKPDVKKVCEPTAGCSSWSLLPLDSEEEEAVKRSTQRRRTNKNALVSSLARRVAGGNLSRSLQLPDGDVFYELRIYNASDIVGVPITERYKHADISAKCRVPYDAPDLKYLKKVLVDIKTRLADANDVFYSS